MRIHFKGSISGLKQFLTIENPLKIMKNIFNFMLITFFVLEIFTFLSWLFGYVERQLGKSNLLLTSNFMTSKTGQQIITIQIVPNFWRSKGNQAMKFGQLTKYKRNIFLKSHEENQLGRLVPDPSLFLKKALYEVKARAFQLDFNIFW